ncbi:MAG: UDP-N-acetylmuramoyl-L-alanine--D-glutamate ligase [Bacteroidales bacterium]|jgi:UDP-N-acetylmuramoylalanine--D-glutamate ligase|nr:UDP-N-acetylmuramoyl-L-alanine--D-glutamate ligase [Bacteroidales bacterium]NMD03521.1 UDP-N-acetylmuramoyl-L-alanine--D-glutamate ligase [Bacteroidales bacterium]OQB62775.1 MAG: UDP-N-acetylmuramoylalanine--D-glutamate ligase [Bacteroidetes bacterium ADurb.Bin145]HOU01961.1 UDP-N-acetylmuramoyl-L-alanine--D-glutamate ligase [Bacteroidales bacterium]HQK67754.1 UDP-N-acetylmuramoyl-L-alanine--D-glutamate ligase [Bacteroidales bacterium]
MKKKIVILGAGESGTGSAVLAKKQGFDVFVSDKGQIKEKYKKLLEDHLVRWEEGNHTESKIFKADEIIKSPGIREDEPLIIRLREKGIPVISEIEFAGRYARGMKICVTGSNGKTTVTNLIYHILQKAGKDVAMTGNVGNSFALSVAEGSHDYYVIELSSFQLDGMYDFKADIAVLMNITPDHLDRYDHEFQNYIDSKFRITRNQTESDYLIYWANDPVIAAELSRKKYGMTLLPFSDTITENMAAYIEKNELIIDYPNKINLMTIHELALKGRHNTYNSMAAAIAGKVLNIRKDVIRESLADFQGVEHRLEPVIKVSGISFINDSKATNVNSTWYALECMETPVVWIVGGIDKGNDYSELFPVVRQKVKAVVCLGKDNRKIIEAFRDKVPTIIETNSMEEAVRSSYYLAKKGETVLLSPACASFDLFNNYEDRGRQFKSAVRNL